MPYVYSRECPFCRSSARSDATVCPHCGRDIPLGEQRFPVAFVVILAVVTIIVGAVVLLNR